ncbi:MAG: hypothetical protein ABSH28_15015 [Acidobacteriota bacterium]|jgi:hypothetical protein
MTSAKSYKLLDLEQDLPTSREDILALRRARGVRWLSFAGYLEFLANFAPLSLPALRARKGPAGSKPFEL